MGVIYEGKVHLSIERGHLPLVVASQLIIIFLHHILYHKNYIRFELFLLYKHF